VSGQIHPPAVVPPPAPPEEGTPFYVRLKGGPRISLDALDKREISSSCRDLNGGSSV